jgi:NADPH-dependent ferric siderophore reductase
MKPRERYEVTVTSAQLISPSIIRITLQSTNIAHFGKSSEGGYFKLLFNAQGGTDLSHMGEQRPVMRTYTIREFNDVTNTITVDFVRHITTDIHCGFASRWAEHARQGDTIHIIGPGKSVYPDFNHDWVFLVADMTALPALSVTLSQINKKAKGYAVIEVTSIHDIQMLDKPNDVEIIPVVKANGVSLEQVITKLDWLDGDVDVWCACEFDDMRTLRRYFHHDRKVENERIYISSYWKNGITEDGHKVSKRQDLESQS